jgi:uncharacterized protein YndB with AHSA1/START domain
MTMAIPDRIERVMELKATQQRVWKAVSSPEGLSKWFPEKLDGDFKVGGNVMFHFGEAYHVPGTIVAIDPQSYFAFRWQSKPDVESGADAEATTLVEFRLEPSAEGTRLTMVESGFAALPAAWGKNAYDEHSEGWTEELGQLEDYLKTRHDDPTI